MYNNQISQTFSLRQSNDFKAFMSIWKASILESVSIFYRFQMIFNSFLKLSEIRLKSRVKGPKSWKFNDFLTSGCRNCLITLIWFLGLHRHKLHGLFIHEVYVRLCSFITSNEFQYFKDVQWFLRYFAYFTSSLICQFQ